MSTPPQIQREITLAKARAWLTADLRITVPGWVVAAASAAVVLLLLVALD